MLLYIFSPQITGRFTNAALKFMVPVDPGLGGTPAQIAEYEDSRRRWKKDRVLKSVCDAYLNARKEISILLALRHPNIVPLMSIGTQPLCLVLQLAPQGALDDTLRKFERDGAQLPVYALHKVIIQVRVRIEWLLLNQKVILFEVEA